MDETVKANYVKKLGKPAEFIKVQCRSIALHKYRCNMWVRDPKMGSKIGQSHVVTVDDKGVILSMET